MLLDDIGQIAAGCLKVFLGRVYGCQFLGCLPLPVFIPFGLGHILHLPQQLHGLQLHPVVVEVVLGD